jgi:hypothetical protein
MMTFWLPSRKLLVKSMTTRPTTWAALSTMSSSTNQKNDHSWMMVAAAATAMAVWQQQEQKAECCGIAGIVALKGVEARYVERIVSRLMERARNRMMQRERMRCPSSFSVVIAFGCFC